MFSILKGATINISPDEKGFKRMTLEEIYNFFVNYTLQHK